MGSPTPIRKQDRPVQFLQTTWKVNSRLTLNGGPRRDPYLPLYWATGQVFHFDQQWFMQDVHSSVYPNAPAGVLYTGDAGVLNDESADEWLHFSPRLGLALDPKGKGHMTIRASYGLFRDYPDLYQSQHVLSSPPFNSVVTLQSPVGGFVNPWLSYPGGNPFPITVTKNVTFPTSATWYTVPLDLPAVYVHNWNLRVQKQVGANGLVSANHVGNEVIYLLNDIEVNPAVYLSGATCIINGTTFTPCSSTGNTTQRRLFNLLNPSQGQYYANIVQEDAGSTMSYKGMLLTAQRRVSNGLTVQANCTWSHCINTGTSQVFGSGTAGGVHTAQRLAANRENCAGLEVDRRHNFNLSTVYVTPRFSTTTLRPLGTNWQISGIVKILSDDSMSITSGIDTSLSDIASDQRPNQMLANVFAPNEGIDQYLNPAAFAQPATGT